VEGADVSHEPRFSIIPGWIVTDPRLKGRDLQVLCLLGRHTDKQGWCRRSQVKMAEQLACARSTVQASLDRLSDVGVVEKHQENNPDGRDSAHFYRVIYDREPPHGYAFDAWQDEADEENIPIEAVGEATPPADISAPPAGPVSAPPAGPGSAPINAPHLTPPTETREREARERVPSGSGTVSAHLVNADLIKRVQKFCTGEGYREGPWPKWERSTVGHIAKQFATLSAIEQDAACEWRDSFLAKCRRGGISTPMPVANFFRDKVWEMLGDADKALVRPVAGGAPASANGKVTVPVFGPAYGAARAWSLVSGPVWFELPEDVRERVQATYDVHLRRGPQAAENYLRRLGLSERDGKVTFPDDFEAQERVRRTILEGYPEANRLHDAAKERAHVSVAPVFERLKDMCEPVPVGSAMWDRWFEFHEQSGWPFVPTPSGMKVVWFPKGGPEGLEHFRRAAGAIIEEGEGHEHAAAE
jgi:hypothetical protein